MIEDNEEASSEDAYEFQQILSSSRCIEHLGNVYFAITSEGVEI